MKAKDILKMLGATPEMLEKAEKEELEEADVKTFHDKHFINREIAPHDPKIKQHFTGALTGKFNRTMKEKFGIEVEDGERWEDAVEKAVKHTSTRQEELEEKLKSAKSQDSDGKVKELTEQLENLKKDKASYEKQSTGLKQQLDETKADYEKRIKQMRVGSELSKIKEQLPFRSDRSNIEKKGFEATLNEQFKFDYEKQGEGDDAAEALVARNSDGSPFTIDSQPVYDPKKVIEHLAAKEGQLAKNGGGAVTKPNAFNGNNGSNGSDNKRKTKSEGFADQLRQQYAQVK